MAGKDHSGDDVNPESRTKGRMAGEKRRSPIVSGIFYPDSGERIRSQLSSWGLADGSKEQLPVSSRRNAEPVFVSGGKIILAPHGAWNLTGNIAAAAFAAVQKTAGKTGKPVRRVLLLAAAHHFSEDGIYLSDSASFETPLGDLQVDMKFNRELENCSGLIRTNDIPHLLEHSLEVLLPMVKYCFPKVKIVPILMRGRNSGLMSALAGALKTALGKHLGESLVVLSSNISCHAAKAAARSMAEQFQTLLLEMDTAAYLDRLEASGISACGGALAGALLQSGLLKGRNFSALCPMVHGIGEKGEYFYYSALGCIQGE